MVKYLILAFAVSISGPLLVVLPVNWGPAAATAFLPLIWILIFSFAWEDHGRKSAWILITAPPLFVAPMMLFRAFSQL